PTVIIHDIQEQIMVDLFAWLEIEVKRGIAIKLTFLAGLDLLIALVRIRLPLFERLRFIVEKNRCGLRHLHVVNIGLKWLAVAPYLVVVSCLPGAHWRWIRRF